MIWALIRAGRKDLFCQRSITSSEGELLFASGVSRHILTSWFSQGIVWGVSRVMRLYTETGRARFEEWSHMAVGLRFRAGAMGVPFLPMRSMMGSDLIGQLPDARVIDCPFTGEKLVLVPALNPDVALIHVQRCDAYGNAQIDGLPFMDIDLAHGGEPGDPDHRAHRLERSDPPRARPDQDPVPRRRRRRRGPVRVGAARVLRPLRAAVQAPRWLRRPAEAGSRSGASGNTSTAIFMAQSRGPSTSISSGWRNCSTRAGAGEASMTTDATQHAHLVMRGK